MPNTIPGFNVFAPNTQIQSDPMNKNLGALINVTPMWCQFNLSPSDFTPAGAVQSATVTIYDGSGDTEMFEGCVIFGSTFTAPGLASATLKIGKVGSNALLLPEKNVFTTNAAPQDCTPYQHWIPLGLTPIVAVLSLTGANINALTGGFVALWLKKCMFVTPSTIITF